MVTICQAEANSVTRDNEIETIERNITNLQNKRNTLQIFILSFTDVNFFKKNPEA